MFHTQKCIEECTFSRYIWPFDSVLQNSVITEEGLFISRAVLLSFLPLFTTVVSLILLINHTSLLSVHTWTVMSPFLWDADCRVFKWLASCSRSVGIPLVSPNSATNSHLCVWQCFSQSRTVTKNSLIEVMILANFLYTTSETVSSNFCPSAACTYILQIYPDTASHTILTSTVYFVIFHGSHILNFRKPRHGIRISIGNIRTQALF